MILLLVKYLLLKFKSELNKIIFNMVESDRVEIIEFSGEQFSKHSFPCSVLLILSFFLVVINFTLMFLFPRTLISTFLSLGIIAIFLFYYYCGAAKNQGKIRKCIISSEDIEISIPEKPSFLITWAEFEEIEVRLKSFNFEPYFKYEFHFIKRKSEKTESEKTFSFSLWDFSKKRADQILVLTKNYARKLGKSFTAVKEIMISGIYQVENLKI